MQILVAATNTADQLWPSPAEGLASTGWNWHHAVMHRLGLGVFVGLVVCCPAACRSEPNSAPVASGTVPPSPATTPCIRSTNASPVGGLRLTVGSDEPCTSEDVAIETGPRLWVQPLFPSDESLAAPVKGVLRYDDTNDYPVPK